MNISKRAQETQASPIRKLYPYAKRAEAEGKIVLYVNIGQPDIATPSEALMQITHFNEEVIAYSPSNGYESLRERVAAYLKHYNVQLTPAQISITTGGSEALFFSLAAVCDAGDTILIPEPFYANYKSFAQMLGITVVPITTSISNKFHFASKSSIAEKVDVHTKAILLCNPSNPTGTVYTKSELAWITEIAKEKGLFIISDEVYREFRYDNTPYISPLHFPSIEEHVIITDSISKRYSSCGARIGFIATKNSQILDAVNRFSMARLSPPTLEQLLAEEEFSLPFSYFQGLLHEYASRRDALCNELAHKDGIIFSPPEGAFYTIVKLQSIESEAFARFLLTDFDIDGVTAMVAPASGFYQTPGYGIDEIRIAFVLGVEKMRLAGKIITQGYNAFKAKG